MPEVIKARCPGCKRDLRIPAEWIDQSFRCKHCQTVVQAKQRTRSTPAGIANLDFSAEAEAPIVRVPSRYRRSKGRRWLGLVSILVLLAIGAGVAYRFRTSLLQLGASLRDSLSDEPTTKQAGPSATDNRLPMEEIFPRRALAICVNNYLYANPVAYGSEDNDVGSVLDKLGKVLHIDPSQLVELSDAARVRQAKPSAGKKGKSAPKSVRARSGAVVDSPARPPLKPVIEKALTDFLDGSRAQDRVIVLFAGHVVEVEDEAFLVPLDGELEAKETLIPLNWVCERLKKCPARQKVLILDTCRLDPGRGLERPGSGPMPDQLDALLSKPPEGVQIWSACSKGQYSYEFDGGSLFLKQLLDSLDPKIIKKIQHPQDSLPVDALAEVVNKKVAAEIASQLKEKQTPRLAGSEPSSGADYDKAQTLPARVVVLLPAPPAGGMAKLDEVKSILDEIELPPIKLAHEETARLQIENLVPFAAKKLENYRPDYTSLKEIESNAGKFPLRVAVLKAVKLIRDKFDPRNPEVVLRENFSGNSSDKVKEEILKEQAKPAELMAALQEAREMLEEAGKNREDEPSRRWQAHYDFVLAELKARIAYVEEYSLMLGKIRKGELPELESGQNGFRLSSRDRLQGTKEFKDMAADSKKTFKRIAKEHKGTPWEILAKREVLTALGLQWQATR